MAHGALVALAVGCVMHCMGMIVTVARVDVEILEAGEGSERIRQHLAGVSAKPSIEFRTKIEPALAFERLKEVRVVWAERRRKGGESL
jgi:hypothetical protein